MNILQDIQQRISSKQLFLVLLVIAGIARAIVASLQVAQGIEGNWFFLVKWRDFYGVYGSFFSSLNRGLLPYLNFGYWYTPFFLYVLYAFYLLGGIHFASIPILATDAATAPLVYLIV